MEICLVHPVAGERFVHDLTDVTSHLGDSGAEQKRKKPKEVNHMELSQSSDLTSNFKFNQAPLKSTPPCLSVSILLP